MELMPHLKPLVPWAFEVDEFLSMFSPGICRDDPSGEGGQTDFLLILLDYMIFWMQNLLKVQKNETFWDFE